LIGTRGIAVLRENDDIRRVNNKRQLGVVVGTCQYCYYCKTFVIYYDILRTYAHTKKLFTIRSLFAATYIDDAIHV